MRKKITLKQLKNIINYSEAIIGRSDCMYNITNLDKDHDPELLGVNYGTYGHNWEAYYCRGNYQNYIILYDAKRNLNGIEYDINIDKQ